MPVLILETVQSVPPVLLVVVPLAVILPLAHTKQSGLRVCVTVKFPVIVASPLHANPTTVACPVVVAVPLHLNDPTVASPVLVSDPTEASAVHVSDPTVASPVQVRTPTVYVAAVSRAILR